MSFKFTQRSLDNLKGVHPDLIKVANKGLQLTPIDFGITEGLRTLQRQKELVKIGASRTLDSRHLTGYAIDVVAYVEGKVRWDWPLYNQIAIAMKKAASALNIPIVWGGDWVHFPDGPHFELDKYYYTS